MPTTITLAPLSNRLRAAARAAAGLAAAAVLLAACATAPSSPPWQPPPGLDPVSTPDWEADMARFAAEDVLHPPPRRPVVFAGSSSFRMWPSLSRDFPGIPVRNRGFGGAQVRDLAWHADAVAIQYQPRVVLLYAGDNDIDAGRSPGQVLADTQVLVTRLRAALPRATLAWVSIKPSPARIDQLPAQREANALVETWLRQQPGTAYIDVTTPMLDDAGRPREALFIADRLHMNAAGYAVWREAIVPWLR
ncbi:SGNH/GDSL hydrolase family protein [Luteimonas sp. A649]